MHKILLLFTVCSILFSMSEVEAGSYEVQKVSEGVYAAIAVPGGRAVSNALFVVTDSEVILAGAHFSPEAIRSLLEDISSITTLPVGHVILTHHHPGFNYIDFDLPAKAELITSGLVWQALKGEVREISNSAFVFDTTMTIHRAPFTLVLNSTGPGHSSGDVIVLIPKEDVLFTSDLFYNDAVGYMGEASVREWAINLELLEDIGARVVIPGIGKVTDNAGIDKFKIFFKDFMTEIIRNIEKGNTLSQAKKQFSLAKHKKLPGYKTFLDVNLERAYKQLKAQQ